MAEIYVPGAIDIMGSANQMMQFRNSQQAQQANALQMQYAAEDRARAAQERSAAAGNARAELARKRELLEIYGNYGATPAPGGTGAPYDPYATLQNKLLQKGFASQAGDIAELQNKNLTGKKTAAEIAGQKATTTGIDYKNTADFIKMTNAQIDSVPDIASLKAVVAATFTPGHPMAKFNELNGLTLEQSMAAIDGLIAQGKTFEQIREQMSQGASKAADNIAARGLVTAQTDKAKGEAGGGGSGGTENERLRAILQKGAEDPNFASTIEYAAAWNALFGEKIVDMPDPNDNSKRIFQRVRVPAPDIYPRPTYKQPNALAPAAGPVAAQPTNALAINAGGYGGGPMRTSQTSTAMQPIRTETGEGMLASVVAPSSARETQTITEENKKAGAKAALDFIGFDPATGETSVDKLLPRSTSGSMEQLGADFFAAFGASTEGSEAIAQLETIASTLTLELAGGKLGAGFTDEDRRFLLNTLGDVANPKKPVQDRLAAWKTAKRYMAQKAGVTLPEDHAKTAASADETTQTYANAKEILAKINASSVSQEKKTELINQVNKRLIDNGLDPAKAK